MFETYAGTGYNFTGDLDTYDFVSGKKGTVITGHLLDYSDPNQVVVTDPRGWGGAPQPSGAIRPGYWNKRMVNDRIWQFHPEISKDLETNIISRISIGGNYTEPHASRCSPTKRLLSSPTRRFGNWCFLRISC